MPSKKKKYNARFPPARIKKIMQSDEEVGKVAQAVPVIISRALELFVESLLKKAETVTHARNAKTLTPSHLKQCIMAEQRFDFLKDLVAAVPDVQGDEESATADTPRSSASNTAFVFPSATATSSTASATTTSSSTSTTSTPAARGELDNNSHNLYLKQEPNVATSSGVSYFEQRPPPVGVGTVTVGGGGHQSLPMTMPLPNMPKRRISSTIMSPPPAHVAAATAIAASTVSGPEGFLQQQESVIVTHPNLSQQHSNSILNPVGANSNPYIPSISNPNHPGNLNLSSQFEYVPNPNGISMNLGGLGVSGMSIPLSLSSVNNSGSGSDNSPSHSGSEVIMYDNKNASNFQSHHSSQNFKQDTE